MTPVGGSAAWGVGVAVAGLVASRIALAAALWRPGWSALSDDDFHRVAIAQTWAARPYVLEPRMIWLPLPAWVQGLAFLLFGGRFADDPMLLVALVNSAAALGTAALLGWSAYELFGSVRGGLFAFAVVLFAPYAVFTSLSGLSEPLYYLTVALAVWGLVGWGKGQRTWRLAIGSLGVAASGFVRYEGWLLAACWLVIVAFAAADAREPTLRGLLRSWWTHRGELVLATLPLLVPVAIVAAKALHYGSVLGFVAAQAETAAAGSIEIRGELARWLYYPLPFVQSAPILVPSLIALAVWSVRTVPATQLVVGLVTLHFVVFCVLSSTSGATAGFRERFLFAFALGLAPLLGAVPALVDRVRPLTMRWVVAAVLAAITAGAGAHGLANPQDDYKPAADLLELQSALGAAARARGRPLTVMIGPGLERDAIYIQIPNGRRLLRIAFAKQHGLSDPATMPDSADVWIERVPLRVASIAVPAGRVIGRYHLYGRAAPELPPPATTLAGWSRRDSHGRPVPLGPTWPLVAEFAADDPRPGDTVTLERAVARGPDPRPVAMRIRRMYGLGSFYGRMAAEVRVDGRTVFRRDIATRGGTETATFEIPPGAGDSVVAVVLVALPDVERGWAWGRASTTVITEFRVAEASASRSVLRRLWSRD